MSGISYDASGNLVYKQDDQTSFVYNSGDISWVLACTALVWIMIPGVGFFYSGLLRRKNALSMIFLSMGTIAVVSFQWWFWGFSLTFSEGAGLFIGDLKHFALRDVLEKPSVGSSRIPSIVFCVYQLMFAAITPMLALGGFAERAHLGPVLVFVFIWSTAVYDPIACWTWNPHGWSFVNGSYDFAGGTPVHISSGAAALAISIYLGKRRGYGTEALAYKPHNTSYVVIGTIFLWFGWFGFNPGSALSANLRAASAFIVTNLAACVGGLTWMAWDYRIERKWSAVGFCSGSIAGLVAITPGSGFVGSPASVLFGFMAGTVCNFATQIKFFAGYDDSLDVFASHAVGGIVGNLLTAIFAQRKIAAYGNPPPPKMEMFADCLHKDGFTVIPGGWLDHHWIQLAWHVADSAAGLAYSFVVTTLILWIMHYIPGLRLRVSEAAEMVGIDEADMGEAAYDWVTAPVISDTETVRSLVPHTATAMNMDPHAENYYLKERNSNSRRSYISA
ncbi:Ammonium transporter [Mycena indigotica]|uniref:Ammonium transporter n=1 Tax=Mycena indigotica TaxID=2126181 RepID=A0A8H6SYY1_9AGAR|nr:Ammonium transporter [Mycena indigotica]KAF7306852.1 Ammonium transporter [Mycena indigotica]